MFTTLKTTFVPSLSALAMLSVIVISSSAFAREGGAERILAPNAVEGTTVTQLAAAIPAKMPVNNFSWLDRSNRK